jgi:CheY-like chemotaxis protein
MAKILVIDDEALLTRSLSVILTKAGHTVVSADNGKAGLEVFAREKPDLVITDIIMPVMEGIEAIQELRAKDPTLPIIAVSGGGRTKNLEFLRIAEKLGANAALGKPFSKEQLLEAVRKCLKDAVAK